MVPSWQDRPGGPPASAGIRFGKAGGTRKHRAWMLASIPTARVRTEPSSFKDSGMHFLSVPRAPAKDGLGSALDRASEMVHFSFFVKDSLFCSPYARITCRSVPGPESKAHGTRASWREGSWGCWGPLGTTVTLGPSGLPSQALARGCSRGLLTSWLYCACPVPEMCQSR